MESTNNQNQQSVQKNTRRPKSRQKEPHENTTMIAIVNKYNLNQYPTFESMDLHLQN
jgi:hypothetical protein